MGSVDAAVIRGTAWYVSAAFVLALAGTGAMRYYALRKNLLDLPNQRSSHTAPTPRGGGMAIVTAFFASLLGVALITKMHVSLVSALVVGGGGIAIIGFLDDHRTVSAGLRFGVHVAVALLVVFLLGGIPDRILANWDLHGSLLGVIVALIALVWTINLFNFMDGIDGIAASEAAFIATAGAALIWCQSGDFALVAPMLCLGAACLGFLAWNWPPARIFMGDAGSGFLGFTLATLGLAGSQADAMPLDVWAILGGVFVVDATVTLVRRMARGERWSDPHRMHAYQHLTRRWKAHWPVTSLALFINLFWLFPWAWGASRHPSHASWYLAAALIPLIILVLAAGAGAKEA
jgi:Fuc2NAc and GlcNAc transferase